MTTLQVKDGTGATVLIPTEVNAAAGTATPHSVPEVGGAAVTPANPMPVAQYSTTASQSLAAGTVGNAVTIQTNGAGTVAVTLAGLTASGATVGFLASDNGGSSFYVVGALSGASNTRYTTASGDGSYTFSVPGRTAIQIAVTAAGTGSITASYSASAGVRAVTIDSSPSSPVSVADPTVVAAVAQRVTLTQTQVVVPAATTTQLLAANQARKSLRIAGTNAADSFRLAYGPGQTAASASSSALFGSGGIFAAEQYGPGDGVPTGAIYAYSAAGFTAQVGEGN